jgi:hypothetical protein
VEASPAYMIEWGVNDYGIINLNSVDQLRLEIAKGKFDHHERLFVIHGLPVDYVNALKTSLDIDPTFIEAHFGRRRYRPLRWRKDARFACYEYPELVRGFRPGNQADGSNGGNGEARRGERRPSRGTTYIDLMEKPPIHALGSDGAAAVFCHASLWMASQADGV